MTASALTLPSMSDDEVAGILSRAFDYKHAHEGKVHVIKASGKIADNDSFRRSFVQQVTVMRRDLGLKVIVVHGAGKQIDRALKDAGKASVKIDGLRVSRADHIGIIDSATQAVNTLLCETFADVAGRHVLAKGLAGHDSNLSMLSFPKNAKGDNFSGDSVINFNKWYLEHLLNDGKTVPIVTNMCASFQPIGNVGIINVNADAIATRIAIDMDAHRLLMCSDVPGVLEQVQPTKPIKDMSEAEREDAIHAGHLRVIPEIRQHDVAGLVQRGVLGDDMKVKVNEAFRTASSMGPDSAVIIMDHNFLVELLTPKGRGTMFRALTA